MESQIKKSGTVWYLSYLRVFATLAVILLHTCSENWTKADVHGFQWNVLNIYDSFSNWGVPVFVMISGALFLSRKELDIKKLYSKNILRLAVSYFVWSFVYALVAHFYDGTDFVLKDLPLNIFKGYFHLWFIPMIIGLYICLPIIRKITESKEITKYFLILSFIFDFAVYAVKTVAQDFLGKEPNRFVEALNAAVADMHMNLVIGYAFYFVLGYVLFTADIPKKQRKIIYILGFCGVAATAVLNMLCSWRISAPHDMYGKNFSITVLLFAVAVFVWCRYNIKGNEKANRFIGIMSKCSFGAYLVHCMVRGFLYKAGFHSLTFNPVFAVPAVFISITAISFLISYLLNKIPFLNKWIV